MSRRMAAAVCGASDDVPVVMPGPSLSQPPGAAGRGEVSGPLHSRCDGGAKVCVVSHVGSVEHQWLTGREIDHLVARVLDDLANALALHDIDGAADGHRACD